MTERVDIFDFLKHVDKRDIYYYSELTSEEQKSIAFLTAVRWFSGTKNNNQILAVNSLVNQFTFKLSNHPDLLYKLMCIASSGTEKRYQWIPKKKRTSSKPMSARAIAQYNDISVIKADGYLDMLALEDVLEYADALAFDTAEIKKIKDEWK
jgi:hypothetical protein